MTDAAPVSLAAIETMLESALAGADAHDEALLGAKIDDALGCVRDIVARRRTGTDRGD